MPIEPRMELDILAPPETVWEVLSDFEQYPSWTEELLFGGAPREGASIPLTVKLFRWKLKLPVRIERLKPLGELRWCGGNRWLMSGSHYFKLEAAGPGRTRLIHGEDFTGFLVPILWLFLSGGIQAFYDRINQDLTRQAEKLAQREAVTTLEA